MITTDIAVIGAGPVGLFAIFEAGLLKMRCHLIDYLPQVGGQLSEIYPKKPIYDIPGYPSVLAQELIDNLMEQAKPFHPTFTLGERIEGLEKRSEADFVLTTNMGTVIEAKVVVIAGGLGCFEPRKPAVENLENFENGKGVNYMILDPEKYRDQKMVIAGGGDSALDWTIYLAEVCSELTLVHRSESFRGAPDSVAKVMALAESGKINLILNSNLQAVQGTDKLEQVEIVQNRTMEKTVVEADHLIPLFGLSPKLGPIEDWNLNINKSAIEVNVDDYSTNIPGIYAIGDINTYTNKLKLILCGFHEAALMSHSAYSYMNPGVKYTMKYTTVNGVSEF
ncbi:NAD(P)/FAD-dependent oxidoreductase [Pedobacter sp. ISL-68]|uniref:NAD(P)/FAD-dependent oxidoreductase n=1 Tax=unclassified Pedobacter TaxID=2628915 RepID=UPI001BE5433C|nr:MULTISPECIES: NAD(P)/FAD-dependent oxidoreductase [unclassified Pedobacter]MBT2563338.1 NAD(P)/FAD-dependent oxidoreductase [Pedobacter sp. ISL-64]MBT2588621.1 NAD(P)/FAD-dependent oxidoreductase [Pedobacter sp. ISL-68]